MKHLKFQTCFGNCHAYFNFNLKNYKYNVCNSKTIMKEINQINSCSIYKSMMHLHQIWTTSEAGCSKKYCHSSSPCFDTELSLIAKWILILLNVRSKWSLALSLISSHILKEKNDSIGLAFVLHVISTQNLLIKCVII